MKYLKIWTNFKDLIGPLEYDEIGRLFEAMLIYAESGEEPAEIDGNERFVWPAAKQMINLAAERAESMRQNGMRGGRPRNQDEANESKEKQEKANESKNNQPKANESLKEKERKEKEYKEKESFLSEDEAADIQKEHDQILDAALAAGFKSSPAERAGLLNLYARHGLEKMIDGINECVKHSATNLAYLEAVLKGSPRKKSDAKDVHGYEQRDYSNAQADAMRRMMEDTWGDEEAK